MLRVSAIVLLPPAVPGLRDAILHVRIEDTRRMDAPARRLAECRVDGIPDTALQSGRLSVELAFAGPAPAEGLSLHAHLDLDRDGAVSPGDFVTTRHLAVPAESDDAPIEVPVTRV